MTVRGRFKLNLPRFGERDEFHLMPQSETTQLVKNSLAFICRPADTRSLTPVSLRRLDLCDQYGGGCHPDADIEPLILLMSMFDRFIPVRFVSPLFP